MTGHRLTPMTPEAFRAELKSRGWTAKRVAERWGMSERRAYQLIADADRPRYYDDAVRGLPLAQKG